MANYLILFLLLVSWGCQSRSSEQAGDNVADSRSTTTPLTTTTPSVTPDTLCYQQVLNRDTTTLRLLLDGKLATGYLDINLYQKDRARGPLHGTVDASRIRVEWLRSGEGVTQPYELNLVQKGDTISWREGEFVDRQGTWVLKEPDAGYQHKLTKMDCSPTELP